MTTNTTLYAKWIANDGGGYIPQQSFTVSFETNGGNVIINVSVKNDSNLAELPTPNKEGFIFKGWYLDEALTRKWDHLTDRVTKNISLYAKWIENTNTATTPDPPLSLKDISGHWAQERIEEITNKGIIAGYESSKIERRI